MLLEEGSPGAREESAGCLRNLAWKEPSNQVAIVQAGALEPLAQLLSDGARAQPAQPRPLFAAVCFAHCACAGHGRGGGGCPDCSALCCTM